MNSVLVTAPTQIEGGISIPGSKSETNRFLILAAQSKKPFQIQGYSTAEDSRLLLQALVTIGFPVTETEQEILITGESKLNQRTVSIWVGSGGTTLRFLLALAATCDGIFEFNGSEQLARRPVLPLLQALQKAGVKIEYSQGQFPIRVYGSKSWKPNQIHLDYQESSQFLSALLLLAPHFDIGTTILVQPSQLSASYVGLTLQTLNHLGIQWEMIPEGFRLVQNEIQTHKVTIGGDWSSASYWLGLASLLPSKLLLKNLDLRSSQGDVEQLDLFLDWGGIVITETEQGLLIENNVGTNIKALDYSFEMMPDLVPTFAVLATYAMEQSTLSGIESLRKKESNRIHALINELNRTGAMVWEENNSLIILPGIEKNTPDYFRTYQDHRMAMSLSLLAIGRDFVRIENPAVVVKSYPEFWEQLESIGFRVQFRVGGALPLK